MPLGIASFLLIASAGFCTLRLLGLSRGLLAVGLAPSAGLAVLAVCASWGAALELPAPLRTAPLIAAGVGGLLLAARQASAVWRAVSRASAERLALAMVSLAVALAALVSATVFAAVGVPLSSHDGAFHVETIHTLRLGGRWEGWYPPGYGANAAALLQLTPWIDTAEGAFQVSLGLILLAPPAVFGLGYAIWRNPLVPAAGALLAALTYWYPYSPHLWSGWPIAAGVVLLLGFWASAVCYLKEPSLRWAVLIGILAAGIVLTHGTEVYSASLGLAFLLAAYGRSVPWRRLTGHLCVALGIAVLLAAPYAPTLLGWAASGGAVDVGRRALGSTLLDARSQPTDEIVLWTVALSAGSALDVPVRAVLFSAGVWWVFRERTGRVLVALLATFLGLALTFTYADAPLVQQAFVLTFPWGLKDRLAHVPAVLQSLIGGVGLVCAARALPTLRLRWPTLLGAKHPTAWRRTVTACVLLAFLVVEGSAVSLHKALAANLVRVTTYSRDDEAAMVWLRQNVRPGELVANDGSADAGIWAPYKANAAILAPRTHSPQSLEARQLILANIGKLESLPEASTAACQLHVRYVFRGAAGTVYEPRSFPPLEELRRSTSLEEVFSSGEAAVYRTRLRCPG